jgi:hypothetical protein
MDPPREKRKTTSTTREIESSNDSEQLTDINSVTEPDSVSPNTNQIRANQTVSSKNNNNDNQTIPEVNSVILLLVFDQHCSCCVH